jgi:membrane protease YdiL (CAAX protease family)
MEPPLASPESATATAPEPPKPGLLGAVGWCLLYVLLVQVVLSVVAILAYLAILALTRPAAYRAGLQYLSNFDAIFDSALGAQLLLVGLAVIPLGTLALSYWALRQYAGPGWAGEIGLTRLPRFSQLVLTLIAVPAVGVLGETVFELAKKVVPSLEQLGDLPDAQTALRATTQWPWWLAVLLIGVGPGVGEELFCRGLLGRGLVGRYGLVAGVLVTSVLFGLLHVDPPHAVAAACIGVVLHLIYLLSRSLWLPILLHTANNSVAALMLPGRSWTLPGIAQLELAQQTWPVLTNTMAAGLLLAVLWAMYQCRPATAQAAASSGPERSGSGPAPRKRWAIMLVLIWLCGFITTVSLAQFNRG